MDRILPTCDNKKHYYVDKRRRVRLLVRGRVQGVGFRPAVYRHMIRAGCGGHVRNTPEGVEIELEGDAKVVKHLVGHLSDILPPRSRCDEVGETELTPVGQERFIIAASRNPGNSLLPVPPDFSICPECSREIQERDGRRAGYAFNTCISCGPRFSIALDVPFDRERSAMESFPLCEECRSEFSDSADRRFHAQTMSCSKCGPELTFFKTGPGERSTGGDVCYGGQAISAAAGALKSGHTVAIKGVGGFNLACDASGDDVVSRIRKLKGRPHKPLAVMVGGISDVRRICQPNDSAEELLSSEKAPIVLFEKKDAACLSDSLAPGLNRLGVMLPYTPLHRLLMDHPETPQVLVMTSCNRSEEPIAIDSGDLVELSDLVDYVLDSNRPICNRCDDSVAGVVGGAPVVFRRSRGYVPEPIMLSDETPPALAVGAMWKNTFTLRSGRRAYMSQHIGDVSDADNADYFEDTYKKFARLLRIQPELVICDKHPDYPSTVFARRLADEMDLPLLRVQHHYAHILSCLAQHGVMGPVIGVGMDGTGYGDDGKIWGGEFFTADFSGYERRYHLKYTPMPGGERAVSEPFRMGLAYLADAFNEEGAVRFMERAGRDLPLRQVCALLAKEEFSPLTSSCGRLFDAVAALLGVRQRCSYEGQAACELEAIADRSLNGEYPYLLRGGQIDFQEAILRITEDVESGENISAISARFHNTVSSAIVDTCVRMREEGAPDTVVLSGGVMQNVYLTERCIAGLQNRCFKVLTHSEVPPNDAGISLGQAAAASGVEALLSSPHIS